MKSYLILFYIKQLPTTNDRTMLLLKNGKKKINLIEEETVDTVKPVLQFSVDIV